MYHPGLTIKQAVDKIAKNQYVLPAIQREFVWDPDQICMLFDSVMQGYPFGDFLFWNIDYENSSDYQYYQFMRDYHERDNPNCTDHGSFPNQQITAVLDGQQRLTAFNIGLRGSMAVKLPRLRWNNDNAFPVKVLALDLLSETQDSDEGSKYLFDFIEKSKCGLSGNHLWYKVTDIYHDSVLSSALDWTVDQDLETPKQLKQAQRTVIRLRDVIHSEPTISYYEETRQNIEHVLRIFIRRNSGGTQLSYSDLLLSIATSQWKNLDARKEVNQLVEDLNRSGLSLSKDFVLKASLMLSDIPSVKFQVSNFKHENMARIEDNWEQIKEALRRTCRLVAEFGFDQYNLQAVNSLLPIAYFLSKKASLENGNTELDKEGKIRIKHWLIRSVLKRVWGGSSDTLLTGLRNEIRKSFEESSDNAWSFPTDPLQRELVRQAKGLDFTDEEIDELADMEFSNRRIFALLTLLFPFIDCKNNHFHIDHIFLKTRFKRKDLEKLDCSEDEIEKMGLLSDRIGNLQLLSGQQNLEKQAKLPDEWIRTEYKTPADRKEYLKLHLLKGLPSDLTQFEEFYGTRKSRLRKRIAKLINPRSATST